MRHPTNRRQGHPRLKEKQRIQRTPHDNKPKIQNSITNRNPLTSSKSLPRYSILKLYIAKWFWEEGIPTDRESRSHRHNPRDNLLNTPNGEHRRTPRHNQREDTTRPIKSPKHPLFFFSHFLTKTANCLNRLYHNIAQQFPIHIQKQDTHKHPNGQDKPSLSRLTETLYLHSRPKPSRNDPI